MKIQAALFMGLLIASQAAFAVKPSDVKFFENASGNCEVRVNYEEGSVKSRKLNVADVKYLIAQPGGVAMFADISPLMTKEWLDKLVEKNKDNLLKGFIVDLKNGSKGCKAMDKMAQRLDQRAKTKKWDDENTQELIIGSFKEADYPPFERTLTVGGSQPAAAPGTK